MEHEGRADSAPGESPPRGRPLPLNSRWVTGPVLRSVAAKLGLPTSASGEDLRQMIDERLTEQGQEPRDILVTVAETEGPGRVLLHDSDGTFLDAELLTVELAGAPAVSLPVEDAHATPPRVVERGLVDRTPDREAALIEERDKLAAEADRYRAELESVRGELQKTKNEVDGVKRRLKEVWKMNCD